MDMEDTDTDSSFASRSPHHSRSPIDRTRVSDYQAEWSARDPSAHDNDERFGLWTIQGPKRRPRFAKKTESGASSEEIPRSKLPSYLITLRPTTRVALASVSQRLLHTTVMAAAPPSELQQHVAIRTNRASNTVTIETYDAQHAEGLLRLTSIRISPNQTIPITAHQTPGKGMCRGVIHRVDPSETAESLRRALYSESHHIIAARLMGKRGACLVTFEGTRPPRMIRYWSVLTKVTTYEARSLVCHNCQGLGHKKDICPHPSTCTKCGREHSVDVECMGRTPYCRNCKQSGHLGTDAECPTRRRYEERSKKRAKDRRSRSRNRRSSRRRSSSRNHGNRYTLFSERSPSCSKSRSVGASASSQSDVAITSPGSQIAKESTNKKVTYASATASTMPPIQRSSQPPSTKDSPALTPATDQELGAMIAALREEERDLHHQVQEIRREMERALAEVNARIAEKAARRKELQARLRGSRAEHASTPMVISPPSVVRTSLQDQDTTDHIVETCVRTIMDRLVVAGVLPLQTCSLATPSTATVRTEAIRHSTQ